MSQSKGADVARLDEVVRFVIRHRGADRLMEEHAPDPSGWCRTCRTKGCTLYTVACRAKRFGAATQLGGSAA